MFWKFFVISKERFVTGAEIEEQKYDKYIE